MIVPYEAMTVLSHHAYPGGRPMYVTRFIIPRRPAKGGRVTTFIRGAEYGGPIIRYDATQGTCDAQLFYQG